jgi:hypothetical protein
MTMHTSEHDDTTVAETTTPTQSIPEPDVTIDLEAIPEILKTHNYWALFRMPWDGKRGRFDKRPRPGFRNNDASTLLSFKNACDRMHGNTVLAYTVSPGKLIDTGLVVIDLDHCFTDGKLNPAAARIVQMFAGTYIERSVSGDGVHIFVYGKTQMRPNEKLVIDGTEIDIEIYSSRRFIVMTGNLIDGGTSVILTMQSQLDALESLIPGFVPTVIRPPVLAVTPPVVETPPIPDENDLDLELKKLRSALAHLDPTAYSDWFCHGIALKRWGENNDREDDAFALFDDWSKTTKKPNYDSDENATKWDSWDTGALENGLTIASIFYAAMQSGYQPSRVRLGKLDERFSVDVPVKKADDTASSQAGSAPSPARLGSLDEGLSVDASVKNTDGCTTSIAALRSSLWTASRTPGNTTRRNRMASVAVCDWLNTRGQFFYHTDLRDFSSAMYFDADEKLLRYVQSDEFLAWLSDAMGINRAEPVFKFTSAAVETEALSGKNSRSIIPSEFWHATADAVYLSNGPGRMYRITALGIDAVDNGTDGVVFSSGSTLNPWTLTDPVNPFDVCSLFKNAAYISDHGKTLLALWACTMLTHQRTKPPLCISGTVGSGKTRLAVGLFELLGIPPRVSAITKNGESDFWTQVACGGLVTFDNADTRNDWLADALAAAATDGGHEKRRLYTDAGRVYLRARSWVIITSANPTFAADGGLADRLLVVRLDRLKKETAESSLTDEIAAARDAGLSWMALMIHRALADTTPVPKGLNRRHPDHAMMAFRIGRAMGREHETIAALRAAEADKSNFNLENDPLGSVLIEMTEQSTGGLHGTASELTEDIKFFDAYWDGKLTPKSFGKRVAKLWPHLEQSLRATVTTPSHTKLKTYTFNIMRTVS